MVTELLGELFVHGGRSVVCVRESLLSGHLGKKATLDIHANSFYSLARSYLFSLGEVGCS